MIKTSRDLKTYLFTYQCDGAEYALRVPAETQQEALARVRRMSTAVYNGEVLARIPLPLRWPVRMIVFLRNLFSPRYGN